MHLAPFLIHLQRTFPQCRIEMRELFPMESLRELKAGRIDAVVCGYPEPELLEDLCLRVVHVEQPVIALPTGHSLGKRRSLRLRELANERWAIWPEATYPGFGASFLRACGKAGFSAQVVAEVNSLSEVFSGVARGDFISYVGNLADNLPQIGFNLIPLKPGEIDMPTCLLWRPESGHHDVFHQLAKLMNPGAEE